MRPAVAIILLTMSIAGQAEAAPPACGCEHFDKLQQELDNAVKLRDSHHAKAEEMERREKAGEGHDALKREYSGWESDIAKGAGAGIVSTSSSQEKAIGYIPQGNDVAANFDDWTSPVKRNGYTLNEYDDAKAHAIEQRYASQGRDLCEFKDEAAVKASAEATSVCAAVADRLVAHERSHRDTCRRMGFIAFLNRSAAELARDEVKAYDDQIVGLEQEIGKALKGAELQFEDETRVTYSAKMFSARYVFTTPPARGAIPENDGKSWRVDLKGMQRMTPENIVIMGKACRMTSFSREVDLGVDASGKQARITFKSFGKTPPSQINCPGLRAHGGSPGVGAESSQEGYAVPLQLSAEHSEDLGKSKLAAMAAGVAKVSGTYKSRLQIICPAPK